MAFLKSLDDDLVIKVERTIKDEDSLAANSEGQKLDLYFLYSEKNYIALQGITYCASFTHVPTDGDGSREIFKGTIVDQSSELGDFSYKWQSYVLEDYGGYCFAFFYSDDEKPNAGFKRIMDAQKQEWNDFELEKLNVIIFIAEANNDMITDVKIDYLRKEDGFTKIDMKATSGTITIVILRIALQALFVIFFFFNFYLFANSEYSIYQRYKMWYLHNI